NASVDQLTSAGDLVTLDASGSTDPEGQVLTYTWTQVAGPPVVLSDANAAQPTFTSPSTVDPTTLRFEVQVSDGTHVTTDAVTVTSNPTGLIGMWGFEGSGLAVTDLSNQGNDGLLTSSAEDPTRIVDGERDNVMQFAGGQIINGIGQGPSGDFSLASWANYNGTGWQTIYTSGQGGSIETWFGIDATSGTIVLKVGSSGDYVTTDAGVITPDTWQHLAGTWDGTTAHIYVDGVDMALTT